MFPRNILKYSTYSSLTLCGLYFSTKIIDKDIKMGIVGLIGSVTTDLLFHPFDLVNTRTKFHYTEKINTFQMTKHLISTTGFTGLYRGGSVTILGSSFSGFVYFFLYIKLKDFFKKIFNGEENMNYIIYTLASILSEAALIPFYYPFELVKTRIETGQYNYKNFFDGIKQIYLNSNKNGLNILSEYYSGFMSSFFLGISSVFLVFFTFENSRDFFAKKRNCTAEEVEGFDYFLCSFFAGFVTSTAFNFVDVYTIRKQVHGDEISFKKFLIWKNLYAMKSGLFLDIFSGVCHTIIFLESLNFYGKIFDVKF